MRAQWDNRNLIELVDLVVTLWIQITYNNIGLLGYIASYFHFLKIIFSPFFPFNSIRVNIII